MILKDYTVEVILFNGKVLREQSDTMFSVKTYTKHFVTVLTKNTRFLTPVQLSSKHRVNTINTRLSGTNTLVFDPGVETVEGKEIKKVEGPVYTLIEGFYPLTKSTFRDVVVPTSIILDRTTPTHLITGGDSIGAGLGVWIRL